MDIITTIVLAIISELLVMLKEYKKIKLHIHRHYCWVIVRAEVTSCLQVCTLPSIKSKDLLDYKFRAVAKCFVGYLTNTPIRYTKQRHEPRFYSGILHIIYHYFLVSSIFSIHSIICNVDNSHLAKYFTESF